MKIKTKKTDDEMIDKFSNLKKTISMSLESGQINEIRIKERQRFFKTKFSKAYIKDGMIFIISGISSQKPRIEFYPIQALKHGVIHIEEMENTSP